MTIDKLVVTTVNTAEPKEKAYTLSDDGGL